MKRLSVIVALVAGVSGSASGDVAMLRFNELPVGTSLDLPVEVSGVRLEWRTSTSASIPRWTEMPYNTSGIPVDNRVIAGQTNVGSAIRFSPADGGVITAFGYGAISAINRIPPLEFYTDLIGVDGSVLMTMESGVDTVARLPNGLPLFSFGQDHYDFTAIPGLGPVVAVDLRIELNEQIGEFWAADNVFIEYTVPAPGTAATLLCAGLFAGRRRSSSAA